MKANINEQFLKRNVRRTLLLRVPWTVSISTKGILGLSSINLAKSLNVLPALSVDFLVIGCVDFFLD